MPRLRAMMPLLPLLALGACVSAPLSVRPNPVKCAALLPPDWKNGVGSAEFEGDGNAKADWEIFADKQTGRIDQADGRTKDAIGIVERCEAAQDQAVTKATRRGFFQRVMGG